MTYLALSNISKSYHSQPVLSSVSLTLSHSSRVGLVGANGVGKSTLLKIITGEAEADGGTVTLAVGRRLGYLAQIIQTSAEHTLTHLIAEAQAHVHALETRLRELETSMAALSGSDLDAILAEYGEATDAFERYGGYELDSRVDAVLDGLRVGHLARDRAFETFSGGEKARVALALLLLGAPDVLLLDEPTNHLDWASLAWLEGYLSDYRGAVLIVSHDREFLNRTVNAIIEIDEHTRISKRYTGDYDAYYRAKVHERQRWQQAYTSQQEEIRRLRIEIKETAQRNDNYRTHTDSDKMLRNAKIAKHESTVSKRVRVAQEKLNRIMANPVVEPPDELRFTADFDVNALQGRYPLTVSGLTRHYGSRCILDHLSFALDTDSRVALVGENGAGKSTLLRLLMGEESPDEGEISFNPGVRVGYLDQEQKTLNRALNVFEAYADGLPGHEQQHKTVLLRSGLFRLDDLNKQVGELSVGQQRKLQIARLIAHKANFLILDEPTNHVSFDVLESLEAALKSFPGPVLVATHDRRFLQAFVGQVWEVRDGKVTQHIGGYAEYIERRVMMT